VCGTRGVYTFADETAPAKYRDQIGIGDRITLRGNPTRWVSVAVV
jgi:hypothetical protein